MRPLCKVCKQRPRAVAYHRADTVQYRSRCEYCIKRVRRLTTPIPRWKSSGYKKLTVCDRCGFRSRYASQILVYHVDGQLNNTAPRNLASICLNCAEEIKRLDRPWCPGDLEPDL
jgi:hypothetical protein